MAAQWAERIEETAVAPLAGEHHYGNFAEQMQHLPTGQTPDSSLMATPLLAQACADALLMYWQSGLDSGRVDPAQPLYIVDLAPAQGRFAWLLLKALQDRRRGRQRDLRICLLACCGSSDAGAALLAHSHLRHFAEQGWLDAATLDMRHGGSLSLLQHDTRLLHADNPLVLLGLGFFQTLPSGLFGVQYGKLFEGQLAVGAGQALSYQWTPTGENATPLLDYYRHRLHSAAILLPGLALDLLHCLQHIAGGDYLLLACDPGVCDEQAIKLGTLMPPAHWNEASAALPVNFHALSLSQSGQGASVRNLLAGDGMVLHLAWRDAAGSVDEHGFGRVCAGLEAAHPGHGAAMRQLAATGVKGAGSAGWLALLRQSGHDPAVLKLLCGAFSEAPPALDDGARRAWQNALAASWNNFMPLQACDDFHVDCAQLAMQLGYWGLAQDCLHAGLERYGEDAHDLYLLAWCEAATGASAEALVRVQAVLALDPSHEGAQTLQARLADKLERWRDCSWYHAPHAADAELCLEPLGPEHAPEMLYQYRDDQIGIMTRLPELRDLVETQAWMAEQAQEPGRTSYAVMHACWGLVGVVSSHCDGAAGYFYYWIGCDFQQRGYGQRAARLLFRQAAAHGVTEIYTSVHQVNRHSRHVLRKLGGRQLPLRAEAPDDEQDFYYFGKKTDSGQLLARFLQLCTAIGSPVEVGEA